MFDTQGDGFATRIWCNGLHSGGWQAFRRRLHLLARAAALLQCSRLVRCRGARHTNPGGGQWQSAARSCSSEGWERDGKTARRMEAWGLEKPHLQSCSPAQTARHASQQQQQHSSAHTWKACPAGQSRMAGCREKSSCSASSSCSSGNGSRLPAAAVGAVAWQKEAGGRQQEINAGAASPPGPNSASGPEINWSIMHTRKKWAAALSHL